MRGEAGISSIYSQGERERVTAAEREAGRTALRRQAWLELGLVILDPAEIDDDWTRRAVTNEAERRFGHRRCRS